MNAYQKAKCEASVKWLKYAASLLLELIEHGKKHRKTTLTVCTKEVCERLADGELVWVRRKSHTNKTDKREEYDILRLPELLAALISDIEEELRQMGDKDAA